MRNWESRMGWFTPGRAECSNTPAGQNGRAKRPSISIDVGNLGRDPKGITTGSKYDVDAFSYFYGNSNVYFLRNREVLYTSPAPVDVIELKRITCRGPHLCAPALHSLNSITSTTPQLPTSSGASRRSWSVGLHSEQIPIYGI